MIKRLKKVNIKINRKIKKINLTIEGNNKAKIKKFHRRKQNIKQISK